MRGIMPPRPHCVHAQVIYDDNIADTIKELLRFASNGSQIGSVQLQPPTGNTTGLTRRLLRSENHAGISLMRHFSEAPFL